MKLRSPKPLVAACCAAILLSLSPAAAQDTTTVNGSFANPTKEPIAVNALVGESKVITFDREIGRFSVSNPEIAEVVLVSPTQVLVNGKAFGQVSLIAWEQRNEKFIVFDVFVRTNLSLIDSQIRALFPKDDIRLSQANGSVVLSGTVATEKRSKQVDSIVQAAGFKTVNMLESPVNSMAQVQLMIRVAEVSRSKSNELAAAYGLARNSTVGYLNSGAPTTINQANVTPSASSYLLSLASPLNLILGNGDGGLTGYLRALKSVGAIRSLAEPNLIAMDGQQASFLAGGEFPVPIISSGGERSNVAVVFKEYGIRLNFKPTIIDENHIRLELEPEVSTIDFANGVRFDGFLIPALKTRRAKTAVELRDGQSFALAGLLDNNEIQSFSKVPGLGDIPVLGHLFKSKTFQKNETELMFIVTAQLVKPSNPDDLPQMRGVDGLKNGSPLGVEPKGEGIEGKSGIKGEAIESKGGVKGEGIEGRSVIAAGAGAPKPAAAENPAVAAKSGSNN